MDAHQKTMRRTGRIPTALLAAVLFALTACSSTGGKPRATGGDGAGQADTPRFTIAMVTHGPPGDTFWDLIRKGAETAAAKDNIELKYSAELRRPIRPTSCRTRSTARSMRIAVTLAKPEALAAP